MCIQYNAKFKCGHTVGYTDANACPTKDCLAPKEVAEDRPKEDCFNCVGTEPLRERYGGPALYYKSYICDHEYSHIITDVERPPYEPEAVLVTPMDILCPDCQYAGYDMKPCGTNPPPHTRSMMPVEFEDLPRRRENDHGSTSKVPLGTSMRLGDSEEEEEDDDDDEYMHDERMSDVAGEQDNGYPARQVMQRPL